MPTIEFYKNLDYDFNQYEGAVELQGLTIGGFNGGNEILNVKQFDHLELQAARDIIACYLRPIRSINTSISSYHLKHLIERTLCVKTNHVINYISNGTLILAMYDAGFSIRRLKDGSPNCFFNVSMKSVNKLMMYVSNSRVGY
jgi:hypothetical protein